MTKRRDGFHRRENGILAFSYQDQNGHWREKYTGTKDSKQARRIRDEFLSRLREDSLPTARAKWTLAQAASLWVEQHAAHLGSEKARKNERSYLRQLVRRLGPKKLDRITLDDLKLYQLGRLTEVRERPINLELRILINVLKEANLWRAVGQHFKPLPEPEADVGCALTRDEIMQLETVAATKDAWLVAYSAEVIAANTGMRGGEIKKLRLRTIDLENRRIKIERTATKTRAGARLIELNQAATEAVCRLYKRAQALGASNANHYLLPACLSRHTKPLDPLKGHLGFDPANHQQSWGTAWRSLRKAAGFPMLRFHDLRHTFITLMAEQGVPLPVVQAMVGHMSDIMVRYYTHISNHAARQAVELLDVRQRQDSWGNSWGTAAGRIV